MQIKVENWDINYEVLGEGYPVVLLHGWLADLETMRPIAEALKEKFKVYLIDVVGFGKSSLPEHPLNSNDFGDFLKELLKNLKIENPILVGHSNGGRIIINAVGRKLVNPRKIVLIDSAGLKPKRSLNYYVRIYFFKAGKFFLNSLPNTKFVKKLRDKLRKSVGSSDYQMSAPVLKDTMNIILNEDLRELLPNIKSPTLLIWGALDTATPISDAHEMEKAITNSGLVVYPTGTHWAYLENIINVNIVLEEFFKDEKKK
ncbi:MAG: alpha/beta hydrolase [Clostridia bacterium]|nr:alpha/beta hydrolase [Clostridia bacterium]